MSEPPRLARRLGLGDAVVLGMGAMLGAGVFAAPAPAAAAAGAWLPAALALAAVVAFANAMSSAALAARSPEAGGTAVYARERLGSFWGFLAGWCFIVGKSASLAAMALTLGAYVAPGLARPLGVGAVLLFAAVNARGVEKTARMTRWLLGAVLLVLLLAAAAALTGGTASPARLRGAPPGARGLLQAAGLLFFAFAGYARLATLGEEVREPARTIPRAIPLALGAVVAVYALVLTSALLALGPAQLAAAGAPLSAAVRAGRWHALAPVVRAGAAVACAGVLLSLLAGVSRTILALARRGELPRALAAVHPRHRTPHRAEAAVAVVLSVIVLAADLRHAIGFSSFGVLAYYALANASAWTLPAPRRPAPRWVSGLGLAGCLALAASLPMRSVIGGTLVIALGAAVWPLSRRRAPSA